MFSLASITVIANLIVGVLFVKHVLFQQDWILLLSIYRVFQIHVKVIANVSNRGHMSWVITVRIHRDCLERTAISVSNLQSVF